MADDDPSVTLSARAGWARGVIGEVLKNGPAWGGWALAGYLVVGMGSDLSTLARQNAVVLANALKMIEHNAQSLASHERSGQDYRRDNLRMAFISCLNQADDDVKRQLCYAQAPEDLAAEIRAWRPTAHLGREPRRQFDR